MAKYHINDNGEVKFCRAKVKPCRFGGVHYSNREDAEAVAAAKSGIDTSEVAPKYSRSVRKNLSAVERVSESSQIKSAASKKSLETMAISGLNLNATYSNEMSTDHKSSKFDVSEIDLIDTPKLTDDAIDKMLSDFSKNRR